MTRESFKKQGKGAKLVSGELLNQYTEALNAASQGRGGRNARSINSTIQASVPDAQTIIGVAVIHPWDLGDPRKNPENPLGRYCEQDANGNYIAPCVETDDGTYVGLYLAKFRYWDISENGWREYPEFITVDAGAYYEGYVSVEGQYDTTASAYAEGPGGGAIPRFWPGEAITVYFDKQSGRAIPISGGTPQDEVFIEYVHRRNIEGNIRVPEHTAVLGETSVVHLLKMYKANGDIIIVDSLWHWLMSDSACPELCEPCSDDSCAQSDPLQLSSSSSQSSSSTSTSSSGGLEYICQKPIYDTKSGFCTIPMGHGDAIGIETHRAYDPEGNCYIHEATVRLSMVGRYNLAAQSIAAYGDIYSSDPEMDPSRTDLRKVGGLLRRNAGSGRFTDSPVFCPQGPDYLCPEGEYSGNGNKVYVALRNPNEIVQVKIDYKVTIYFEPDPGGLSSSSVEREDSSVSSSSQTLSSRSSVSSSSSLNSSSSVSSLSTSSESSISLSSESSSLSTLSSLSSQSGSDAPVSTEGQPPPP